MHDAPDRATIDALVAAINGSDLAALDRAFTEDVAREWPRSGERIRGDANRREIYSRFFAFYLGAVAARTGAGAFDTAGRVPLPLLLFGLVDR